MVLVLVVAMFGVLASSAAPKTVVCWGDSITEGMAMKPTETYPARLQVLLGDGFKVLNSGDGGEDAVTIPARQGGLTLKTATNVVFAAGERKVLLGDSSDNGIRTADGRKIRLTAYLGHEVPVNPVRIGSGVYRVSFTEFNWTPISYNLWIEREDASMAKKIPAGAPVVFASTLTAKDVYCEVFLMGANGGYGGRVERLIALYRRMIARRKNKGRYLVIVPYWIGFTRDQEEVFRAAFGNHAVLFREESIRNGLREQGLVPTEQDRVEMASGHVPPSLLYQNRPDVHLNAHGYHFMAKLVFEQGRKLGYW